MLGSVLDIATVPDLLRILVIPFFAYVAWRDIKTRRVPNELWIPLASLALVLFAWETYTVVTGDLTTLERQQYYIQVTMSVGFLVPLSYLFWRMGGFGGADAKAFIIIAVLFPTYPFYDVTWLADAIAMLPGATAGDGVLPVVQTTLGVFSITVLSNTVLIGVLYPVALAGKNAVSGYVSPGMFVAKPVRAEDTIEEYGTLLEFSDRGFTDDLSPSGMRQYFRWRGLDLDALRMYLQWRGETLADLRANPDQYRDPASLPEEPNHPGDGAIADEVDLLPDGGEPDEPVTGEDAPDVAADATGIPAAPEQDDVDEDERPDAGSSEDDPWGAEAFLEDIEGSAYGTTPEKLRRGLDQLTEEDVVWISPGIPFIVPMFLGLVVAYTYGDLLFAILQGLGMVQ